MCVFYANVRIRSFCGQSVLTEVVPVSQPSANARISL